MTVLDIVIQIWEESIGRQHTFGATGKTSEGEE